MPSKPDTAILVWKYETERPAVFRELARKSLEYSTDSDGVTSGIQNTIVGVGIPYNPAAEWVSVSVLSSADGRYRKPAIYTMGAGTTLRSTGGITDAETTWVVDHDFLTTDFRAGDLVRIDDEICVIVSVSANVPYDTWVVRRARHGTEAAAHLEEADVYLLAWTVPTKAIQLVGDAGKLSAPTLAIAAILNGLEITFTPPTDAYNQLSHYLLYRDASAGSANINPTTFLRQVPAHGDLGGLGVGLAIIQDILLSTADFSAYYHYRAKSVTKTGNISTSYSNEVASQPLTSGPPPTAAGKADAPICGMAGDGTTADGRKFQFTIGLDFSSTTAVSGVTKCQIQVALHGVSHDTSTGFASTVDDVELGRPGVKYRSYVGSFGTYQCSGRVYNETADEWSDWSTPDEKVTTYGITDTDLPGAPASLIVSKPAANNLRIDVEAPAAQANTLHGYDIQMSDIPFSGSGGLEADVGLTNLQPAVFGGPVLGEETGALSPGGTTLTCAGSGWTPHEHQGRILYLYITADAATGEVAYPHAHRIEDNAEETLTVSVNAPFTDYETELGGDNDAVGVIIAPGWAATGAYGDILFFWSPSLSADQIGTPANQASQYIIWMTQAVYIRVRARTAVGHGPWIYWDGVDGSTDVGDAATFDPT